MSALAGTPTLTRFVARRERVRLPAWVLLFLLVVAATAGQSEGLYATQAERDEYATTVAGNPGLVALVGPAYDVTSVGGDVAWQLGGFGAVAAALISAFALGRHTRVEEQSGRSELIRATAAGRAAPTVAALLIVLAAQLALAALTALVLIALGQPAAGSLALGASLLGAGLVFAGVAAVAAQVSQTASGMYGLVGAALGVAYALRAAGDVGDGTLSWLSPIGWGQAMRPFADERWWPLLLSLAATAALLAVALRLLARRDDGAGALAARPGPAAAGAALTRPLGLALRQQRIALLSWSAGLFLGGVMVGMTARDAEELVGDGEEVQRLLGGGASVVDEYLALSLLMLALASSAFAVQSVMRMRREEASGRLELLLATALGRWSWAGSQLAVALLGTVVALAAAGLGTGVAYAVVGDDAGRVLDLTGAAVALAPAAWVVAALALLLLGAVPRATAAAWAVLGACFLLAFLGPLLQLPQWALDLSPFEHVPQLPADAFAAAPLLALTAVAAALAAAGLAALRRRDVG